jgi:hypothetical protein
MYMLHSGQLTTKSSYNVGLDSDTAFGYDPMTYVLFFDAISGKS